MKEIIKKNFLMIPLILVEIYLIFTLLLYQFGPLEWMTENVSKFWLLIVAYHLAFIFGYILSIKKIRIGTVKWSYKLNKKEYDVLLWILIIICTICACIEYKNITHASSYIPYELPQNFINGLLNPAEQYYGKFVSSESYVSNKFVTIISAIFSFIYFSIIPFLIIEWRKINLSQKLCLFLLIFFKVATYVSVGTNKGIFDTMFIFAGTLLVLILLNFYQGNDENIDKNTFLKVFVLVIFLSIFSFSYFVINISSRVDSAVDYAIRVSESNIDGNKEREIQEEISYSEEQEVEFSESEVESVVDDSTVKENDEEDVLEDNAEVQNETIVSDEDVKTNSERDSFIKKMYYSVSNYLTQGYYGMSLALDEDFTTTYGIGNSQFLQSNFKSIFGIDVQNRTYQHKITDKWDEFEQWHSFYSYMANDISFYGVIVLMFILGGYFACVCKDVILNGSLIGKLLLPLFIIMIMYMPANNQVFTSMATFCAFFELTFLWIVTKVKLGKGKKYE